VGSRHFHKLKNRHPLAVEWLFEATYTKDEISEVNI